MTGLFAWPTLPALMPLRVLVDTRKLNAPRLAVAAPGMTAGEAGPPSLESFAKVVGPLCLEGGKAMFPSADHVDAPALVLGWWLEVVQALFEKKRPAGILGFAGGPFEVRVTVEGAGRAWLLDLCERRVGHGRGPVNRLYLPDFFAGRVTLIVLQDSEEKMPPFEQMKCTLGSASGVSESCLPTLVRLTASR